MLETHPENSTMTKVAMSIGFNFIYLPHFLYIVVIYYIYNSLKEVKIYT